MVEKNSKKFPVYTSHSVAHEIGCFHCAYDLSQVTEVMMSQYPTGHGKYRMFCEMCKMTTFYDLTYEVRYQA